MATATRALVVKVADEVWIACALLHRENAHREDFLVAEILERATQEGITPKLRPGVYTHIIQHCVANRPPSPGRYRMLYETSEGRRRLYRAGDYCHPGRQGGKTIPDKEEIPHAYHGLVDWYRNEYTKKAPKRSVKDSILELRGLGKEIWKGVDPDEYIRELREGWE